MKETFGRRENNFFNFGRRASGAGLCKILLELLRRREELAPLAKEFSILDKTLKDYFCGVEYFRIGPYQIRGFLCNNKTVCLPKKLQDKYTKTSKVWVVDINKIKK